MPKYRAKDPVTRMATLVLRTEATNRLNKMGFLSQRPSCEWLSLETDQYADIGSQPWM